MNFVIVHFIDNDREYYINLDKIAYIERCHNGCVLFFDNNDSEPVFIKESPEELLLKGKKE